MDIEDSIKKILEKIPYTRTPKQDLILILSLYKKTNRKAGAAQRILKQEPYFSNDQDYHKTTILRYWKLAGLEIRSKGGDNVSGKHWKCRPNSY